MFTPEKGDAHHLGLCRDDSGSHVNHKVLDIVSFAFFAYRGPEPCLPSPNCLDQLFNRVIAHHHTLGAWPIQSTDSLASQ
jgi:hypothetical protein